MLAQNLKTPTDLGIKDEEFDALVTVLRMLEREEITYAPCKGADHDLYSKPQFFNMLNVDGIGPCGTTGCLVGWARLIANDHRLFTERRDLDGHLNTLFMMGGTSTWTKFISMNDVQPSQAAIALRNYLTYGEPRWAEVFSVES